MGKCKQPSSPPQCYWPRWQIPKLFLARVSPFLMQMSVSNTIWWDRPRDITDIVTSDVRGLVQGTLGLPVTSRWKSPGIKKEEKRFERGIKGLTLKSNEPVCLRLSHSPLKLWWSPLTSRWNDGPGTTEPLLSSFFSKAHAFLFSAGPAQNTHFARTFSLVFPAWRLIRDNITQCHVMSCQRKSETTPWMISILTSPVQGIYQ